MLGCLKGAEPGITGGRFILSSVGILQQTLQQCNLLIVGPLLGQLQHLVLVLKTNQMFSGATHGTEETARESEPSLLAIGNKPITSKIVTAATCGRDASEKEGKEWECKKENQKEQEDMGSVVEDGGIEGLWAVHIRVSSSHHWSLFTHQLQKHTDIHNEDNQRPAAPADGLRSTVSHPNPTVDSAAQNKLKHPPEFCRVRVLPNEVDVGEFTSANSRVRCFASPASAGGGLGGRSLQCIDEPRYVSTSDARVHSSRAGCERTEKCLGEDVERRGQVGDCSHKAEKNPNPEHPEEATHREHLPKGMTEQEPVKRRMVPGSNGRVQPTRVAAKAQSSRRKST
ncbi:hypothetical protein EYF80_018287 [Liparis tanakae]|uniref:Uncharacterized protein n=1 Tax=Liparis tanakae TaxID=230148 RepID=A0A4Z2I2I5_9TELE|nr:hypothetical protein EYF80_018287 [Liparis tanakae]